MTEKTDLKSTGKDKTTGKMATNKVANSIFKWNMFRFVFQNKNCSKLSLELNILDLRVERIEFR